MHITYTCKSRMDQANVIDEDDLIKKPILNSPIFFMLEGFAIGFHNYIYPTVSSDEALARKLQSEEDKALAFKMSKLPDKTETSRKGTPPLSKATSSPERHPKRPPTKRSPPVVGLGGGMNILLSHWS